MEWSRQKQKTVVEVHQEGKTVKVGEVRARLPHLTLETVAMREHT